MSGKQLVIFGVSNILSDLFDCALANGLTPAKIVIHHPEQVGERDVALADRLAAFSRYCTPQVIQFDEFVPQADELYVLGPTTPSRAAMVQQLQQRHHLQFHTLVHPSAYVSPFASLSEGVFVNCNSAIGPGAQLAPHVFINRGATVGHDTQIGEFSRVQPGSNIGGLTRIGRGVTIGIGATVLERLVIGDGAFIGAGAVVLADVPAHVLMTGVPAKIKKSLV